MEYVNPTIGQALLISLVGFVTVFLVLVVLMLIIKLMSAIVKSFTPVPVASAPTVSADPGISAPDSVTLQGVDEKDAAVIMALVADELGKDPAELRFISIKEVNKK